MSTAVMDVFEAQSRARRRSVFLIALWLTLTAVMVVAAYGFVWFFAAGWPFEIPIPGVEAPIWKPALAIPVAVAVIGAVVGDADRPGHEGEARLVNVAEEMAIAAGLPVPSRASTPSPRA